MSVLSSTLCPLPWMHLSVNTDTSLRVCCNTDHGGHIKSDSGEILFLKQIDSIQQLFNNDFMRSLRRQMLLGERPHFCQKCYSIEDHGGTSVRQIYARQYNDRIEMFAKGTRPDGETKVEITYLDFSLSNKCNLKCRMCNPASSISLKREFDEIGLPYSKQNTERALREWDFDDKLSSLFDEVLPTTEEVLTTGGEPFLSREHLELATRAVQSGRSRQMILRYHTNLSVLPEKLVSLWSHFKGIEVHTSIEAAGELNDFIRYPSNWENVKTNLRSLIALKATLPLWIEVHTCFQALNFLRISELLDFLSEFRNQIPVVPFFIRLDNPSFLAVEALPPHLRELGSKRLENHLASFVDHVSNARFAQNSLANIQNLRSYLSALNDAPYDPARFLAFKTFNAKLDTYRRQDLRSLIPEIFA